MLAVAVLAAAFLGTLSLGACGTDDESEPAAERAGASEPREDGERLPTGDGRGGVELVELGSYEAPVFVAQAPGDESHIHVVEQCGRILRVPYEGGAGSTFLDLSDRVRCGGEQGLLSVAFEPGYERTGLLYVYFTDNRSAVGDGRLVEYRRSAGDPATADPGSARELLRVEDFAPNHNGGLLLFGPDGNLYLGLGDGGGAGDPERTAQDRSALLGKILRVDPRADGERPYSIPDDNPYLGDRDARAEILAEGLRNPWRFSFDRETGDLWIGDVGQDAREEIDAAAWRELASRLDFGWSALEGTEPFNDDQADAASGARPPVHEYANHGENCSVTGGYVVRDRDLPTLYGRYLYGDFCAGKLRSFTARRRPRSPTAGEVRDDRPLGLRVPGLASFSEDSAGRIYAISLEGPVYRLVAG